MKNKHRAAVALLLFAVAASAANAATIQLRAWLNGAQEVPSVATTATGLATVSYDTVTGQLSWDVTYSGLSSNINGAHFHGPTPAGVDAGITVPMSHGPSPITGAATLNATQAGQLLSGQWYINIHTTAHGNGEIRGQVVRVRWDFDGDGRSDILWRNAATGQNYMYLMNGTEIADEGYLQTVSSQGWRIVGVGDFDGDGRSDILWRNAATGQNYMYLMSGTAIAHEGYLRTVSNLDWRIVGVGDFDGDGRSDILWRNTATSENYVYLMNGTAIAGESYLQTVSNPSWRIIGVGDFNGDGRSDILWRNVATGQNYMYLMNGTAIAGEGYLQTVSNPSWRIVGVGDFNGDGRSDILWRNATTGQNYVYLMNGLAIAVEGYLRTVTNTAWNVVQVGDFDGDGRADILWRNSSSGEDYVYLMGGTSVVGEAYLHTVANQQWQPAGTSTLSASPAFPLVVSSNQRYLQDQNGVPFPIMGRTAWFVTSLSTADYRLFIDDTVSKGYSAIEFHVINHDPRGHNPPFSGNGEAPFLKRLNGSGWSGDLPDSNSNNQMADFTTPNEAYWTHVDALLAYAESKGLLVFLFPAYVGNDDRPDGWMKEMVANGPVRMSSYGAWIAGRYKNQKNLVWMAGGDSSNFPPGSDNFKVEEALLTGVKSVPGQQSVHFSAEWNCNFSIATERFASLMTLNGACAWNSDVNSAGRGAYAYSSPSMPAFLLEEPYDEEGPDGNSVNLSATQPVRRFQWWGWLSTIGGYVSGNGYVWRFRPSGSLPANDDWRLHLNTQGAQDMARLNAFIRSIAWHRLVPSGLGGMQTLIIGGPGPAASDYVAAAASPDRTLLVAYVPPDHSGSIAVDMSAMAGPVRARWFNPASGTYTAIGSGFPNTGTRNFTPPGNNGSGSSDWVLVLDLQ